jgi:hypothetical protein
MKGESIMQAWDVYRKFNLTNNKTRRVKIDTVFYDDNLDRDYVRDSLINHDGYPYDIVLVKCRMKRREN